METTTQEKRKDGGYTIGIDIKNSVDLVRMGKMVEKKIAVPLFRYYNDKIYFKTNEKFLE